MSKASLTIRASTGGISAKFTASTAITASVYMTAIIGTSFSVSDEILSIPPNIISAVIIDNTIPQISLFMPKPFFSAPATEFDCVMFPMPKAASVQKKANITASGLQPRPFSM